MGDTANFTEYIQYLYKMRDKNRFRYDKSMGDYQTWAKHVPAYLSPFAEIRPADVFPFPVLFNPAKNIKLHCSAKYFIVLLAVVPFYGGACARFFCSSMLPPYSISISFGFLFFPFCCSCQMSL